jgi:hypothetical protein
MLSDEAFEHVAAEFAPPHRGEERIIITSSSFLQPEMKNLKDATGARSLRLPLKCRIADL